MCSQEMLITQLGQLSPGAGSLAALKHPLFASWAQLPTLFMHPLAGEFSGVHQTPGLPWIN